jgi:hypothetical protein
MENNIENLFAFKIILLLKLERAFAMYMFMIF